MFVARGSLPLRALGRRGLRGIPERLPMPTSPSQRSALGPSLSPLKGGEGNSSPGYDPVARSLHWLIAALAVIVVSLGWAIPGAARETGSRELLLLLHRSVGLLIIAVMLGRALWRLGHPPPPLPSSLALIERL